MRTGTGILIALAISASSAHADNRAWNAGKKVAISTADGITTYDTGGEQLYMRWVDKSTLVFSAAGKDNLVKQTKGGLGSDKTVAAGVSGVKGDAALAVIYNGAMPLDQV